MLIFMIILLSYFKGQMFILVVNWPSLKSHPSAMAILLFLIAWLHRTLYLFPLTLLTGINIVDVVTLT